MERLDFMTNDQLLPFFHCSKSEISCMKNPQLFLNQLRDHNLIPEDRYKKLSRMKSKENFIKALYDFLDWLEKEKTQCITSFWKCVFNEAIMDFYPTLKRLHSSLFDGSFSFYSQPVKEEKQEDTNDKKELLVEEKSQTNSVKQKKLKLKRSRSCDTGDKEAEPAGPSSQQTPTPKKRAKKIIYSSPQKKGEKKDIWNWPIYKIQLPVKCGDVDGVLYREKLAKAEKCIRAEKQWFTPGEFEKFEGKESSRNWKLSIQCNGTKLIKLIQDGHLKPGIFKKGTNKVKKLRCPSINSISDSEDEDQELATWLSSPDTTDEEFGGQAEQSPEASAREEMVLPVRCGELTGMLHKKRFVRGDRGKSIRTEIGWMFPVDFAKKALENNYFLWWKDITYKGQPLSSLSKDVLYMHPVLCTCKGCNPLSQDLDNEKNDDQCCICKSDGGDLVECDECPRSFHQKCHLPFVDEATVGDKREWMCTFCVLKAIQDCRYSDELETEAVLSGPISQHILECQYLILYLLNADEKQMFATDPTAFIKNYSKFIKSPMWLEKVAEKLQEKLYRTVGQFVSDIRLIFINSATFNKSNPEYLFLGEQLKKLFEEELKNVFKNQE